MDGLTHDNWLFFVDSLQCCAHDDEMIFRQFLA